jgi:hypothetical protein
MGQPVALCLGSNAAGNAKFLGAQNETVSVHGTQPSRHCHSVTLQPTLSSGVKLVLKGTPGKTGDSLRSLEGTNGPGEGLAASGIKLMG